MAIEEKILKLVALAGSSNLEEARTAAYQACRLIRENKLTVAPPKPPPKPAPKLPKYDPSAPLVHLTESGLIAVCGEDLEHEINYYYLDYIPTLQNVCHFCIRREILARRMRRR